MLALQLILHLSLLDISYGIASSLTPKDFAVASCILLSGNIALFIHSAQLHVAKYKFGLLVLMVTTIKYKFILLGIISSLESHFSMPLYITNNIVCGECRFTFC